MGHNCYPIVFVEILQKHFVLLSEVRLHSFLQFLLLLSILVLLPPLKPILLHHIHRLLHCFFTSLLTLKSLKLIENVLSVFRIEESADVPGFLVLDVAEVKLRKYLHGLFYFWANIVGWFHYLPESWLHYHFCFWFVVIKNNVAGSQGSPHGRYNNYVDIDICHLQSGLFCLLDAFFSYLNIQVFVTELLVGVLLTIWELFSAILGFHLLCAEVKLGLCVSDEIYHFILFWDMTGGILEQMSGCWEWSSGEGNQKSAG